MFSETCSHERFWKSNQCCFADKPRPTETRAADLHWICINSWNTNELNSGPASGAIGGRWNVYNSADDGRPQMAIRNNVMSDTFGHWFHPWSHPKTSNWNIMRYVDDFPASQRYGTSKHRIEWARTEWKRHLNAKKNNKRSEKHVIVHPMDVSLPWSTKRWTLLDMILADDNPSTLENKGWEKKHKSEIEDEKNELNTPSDVWEKKLN